MGACVVASLHEAKQANKQDDVARYKPGYSSQVLFGLPHITQSSFYNLSWKPNGSNFYYNFCNPTTPTSTISQAERT